MGVLNNIDDTLAKSDNAIGIMSELSLLPNVEHNFTLFKKTYLDAKDIWLYEYRFECPNILKKLNDTVNNDASNFCTKFNGFEITVAVRCNSTGNDVYALKNYACVTYTFEITNERGHKMLLNQHESTYAPRASFELFADSLFRLKLCTLSTIFRDVDSIYAYLNGHDLFRGYKLI
jgi:hypothetical protein